MKNRYTCLLFAMLICGSVQINGQSHQFLKTLPGTNEMTPAWAAEMYKEHPNVAKVDELYKTYYSINPFEKSTHTQNYKFWRRQVEEYMQEDGSLLFEDVKKKEARQKNIQSKRSKNKSLSNTWTYLGPNETYSTGPDQIEVSWQANVYAIDQSKSHPDILYAGAEASGVYKSTNKGLDWELSSFDSPMRTVNAVTIHPTNPDIVYAGNESMLIKTTDGGKEWNQIYSENGLGINDICIHAENTNTIFLASKKGLYRSEDGGVSWTISLEERIWDIESKVDSPDEMFVLMSNPLEKKSELWKSEDAGMSFQKKENGWYHSEDPNRYEGGGRLTVTPADPNRIYAFLIGDSKAGDNGFIGIYRSDDAGETWYNPNPPDGGPYTNAHPNLATLSNTNALQQGYYNLSIAASHEDPDQFLAGALNLWHSMDGGQSYEAKGGYQGNLSWMHPDQQEIMVNGSDAWVANDGGINYSTDFFETHESRKRGLTGVDFWGFGSGWNEDLVVGGRYHNGNTAYRPSFGEGRFLRLGGAEAATGYIRPGGESVAYFSDISAKQVPDNLDGAVKDVANLGMFPSESFYAAHYSELEFDPSCYGHVWIGNENKLWKSEDGGNEFSLVQSFGSDDQPIQQFELSSREDQVIYVYQRTSFYGAVLWCSRDGGNSWVEKPFPIGVSSMRAGVLQIHAEKPETLWVAFAHQNNDGNKLFRSDDYGDTWTNISDPILDGETIHCLFHHAGTESDLYVGTDFGFYYLDGDTWSSCQEGLPFRVNSNRFMPFYRDNKLRFASYGTGIWEMELNKEVAPIARATVDKRVSACTRDTFYFDDYSILEHDENVSWEWSFDPDPVFVSDPEARNPKVVFGELGSYDVYLSVTNDHGTDSDQHFQMIEILDNQCAPDIYPGLALETKGNSFDFAQTDDIQLTTEEFTLTAWVYPISLQSDYAGIVFNDGEITGLNFTQQNKLGFHYEGAGSQAWAWDSGLTVSMGQWNYVAMVADPEGVTLYVNGVPSRRNISLQPTTFSSLKLGSYRGWQERNFNGHMDEVTVWDRALTEEEIRTQRHISKTALNAPGLVSYYQFNEEDGVILDRIGQAHAYMQGFAERTQSGAPIGQGTSTYIYGEYDGIVSLEEEQIECSLVQLPEDAVTINKLNIAAEHNLETIFPTDAFWIINVYGGSVIDELNFKNQNIDPYYEENPSDLILMQRSENSFFQVWNVWEEALFVDQENIEFDPNIAFGVQLLMNPKMTSNIDDLITSPHQVYPNPSHGDLKFKGLDGPWMFSLIDNQGNRVFQGMTLDGSLNLSRANIRAGIYHYQLESGKTLKFGKIILVD